MSHDYQAEVNYLIIVILKQKQTKSS